MLRMSPQGKKWLRRVLNVLLFLASGYAGMWALLLLLFGRSFERHAIIVLYPATVFVLFLLVNGQWRKKGCQSVVALWGTLVIGFGIYLGVNYARLSVPMLDDRSLQYSQYHPFEEDTKAVTLPGASTLHLSEAEALTLRIDGATALYPVYASFARNVFEPSASYTSWTRDPGESLACSGTTFAYRRLISGEADLIFCAAPSQAQLDAAAEAGLTLHMTPIGREAFVFFVNEKNPVTGLTVEQIQQIYTGEITNWKDVGGKRQKILAYQRDEGSGSQSALERLMAGLPLMEPATEERIDGMGGIIKQVVAYRNFAGALGFTFRFYATEMVGDNQIRLLALNGVAPTKETIRDGSYPISSCFYAITASPMGEPAPEESNPLLKAFLDWCLSEQGQWIVEEVGYVGMD